MFSLGSFLTSGSYGTEMHRSFNMVLACDKRNLALIAILAGAVAIGVGPIFARLSNVHPLSIAFYRVFFAIPLLYIWIISLPANNVTKIPKTKSIGYILITLAGVFFSVDIALFYLAMEYTSVANATLIINLAPVFVVLFGWLVLKDKPSLQILVGLVLAILGLSILVGKNYGFNEISFLGNILALIGAMFYAAYILAITQLRRSFFSTSSIMLGTTIAAAIFSGVAAIFLDKSMAIPTVRDLFLMLGNAWLAHVIGQSLITYGMQFLPASFSSVCLILQPAVVAAAAWLILNEPLSLQQMMGAALIIIAIFVIQVSYKRVPR